MINISKISKKYSQIGFLGIFISFFAISITHSHHFELLNNSNVSNEHENHLTDLYLDSDLNCTISYLSNSLISQVGKNELFDFEFEEDQDYITLDLHKPFTKQFFYFGLRGPPEFIS